MLVPAPALHSRCSTVVGPRKDGVGRLAGKAACPRRLRRQLDNLLDADDQPIALVTGGIDAQTELGVLSRPRRARSDPAHLPTPPC